MKQVIQGLEEGLQAIAEALEADSIVPTPAAADEGKVLTAGDDGTASWEEPEGGLPAFTSPDDSGKALKLIEQDQEGTLAPEWTAIREVPTGGSNGQVLGKTSNGYGWKSIVQVPSTSGASNGDVLTNDGGIPTWAPASGGGGSSSIKHIYQAFRGNTIFDDGNGNATITINSVPSGINEDSFCPLGIVVRYDSSSGSYPKYCNVIPVKGMNIGNLLGTGMMITVIVDSANVTGHLTSSDYYDIGIVYYEKESM